MTHFMKSGIQWASGARPYDPVDPRYFPLTLTLSPGGEGTWSEPPSRIRPGGEGTLGGTPDPTRRKGADKLFAVY